MKIVESRDRFELHISSPIVDNIVTVKGNSYNYGRIFIPKLLVDYFVEKYSVVEYVFLYFVDDSIFLSVEKLDGLKFSKRKMIKLKNKNSYFITLNERSLRKHGVSVGSNVLFVVGGEKLLDNSECISIELRF